jgi:hypothetical protein
VPPKKPANDVRDPASHYVGASGHALSGEVWRLGAELILATLDDAGNGDRDSLRIAIDLIERAEGKWQRTTNKKRQECLALLDGYAEADDFERVACRAMLGALDPAFLKLTDAAILKVLRPAGALPKKAAKLTCACGAFGDRAKASHIVPDFETANSERRRKPKRRKR